MNKRLFLLTIALWALTLTVGAQLSGIVIDRYSGDSIPNASLSYKGHKVSAVADNGGKYTISRQDGWKLTISAIGYKSETVTISNKVGDYLVVTLRPDSRMLKEVYVNSKKKSKYKRKNNPAVELMRKVIQKKKFTDLKVNDYYQYDKYQKLTLALNEITPEKLETQKMFKKQWVVDQVEVCPYNNKLILPVTVEENLRQEIYRKDPKSEKSILRGEKIVGVNKLFQTGDILNVAMNDIFTNVNIYQNEIRLLQHPFTSPISDKAIIFYRYYIADTTYVGNDRCIQVDFTPNNQQDFGFRGTIYILDDTTYQVKRCELTIPKTSEVNFVEDMRCIQEFSRAENGSWVLTTDDMFVELTVLDFVQKFIVIRNTRNTGHSFAALPDELFNGQSKEIRDPQANNRDEAFWNEHRQVQLTKSESSLGDFVKHLKQTKGFGYVLFGLKLLFENYVETGNETHPSKIDIGPVNTTISQNFYDGLRFRASAQTTANLNPHLFFKGYYAHGCNTGNNYYNAEVTYSFNKKEYLPREFPRRTLAFTASHDVAMPSDKFIQTDKDNVFVSLKMHKIDKMFLYTKQDLDFIYEYDWGLRLFSNIKAEKMEPVGDLMKFETLGGELINNVRSTELTLGFRYAPGETYMNSKQRRRAITYNAPVFRLQHTFGINSFLGGNYNYNLTEAEIYKRIWMPHSWGKIDLRLLGGVQWNKVPFTYLIMPVANLSYIIQRETFDMINNMEFLNDRYASLDLTWDFNGKIFNRIPLFKKLKWREIVKFRSLWGTLSDKNNPQYYLDTNKADNTVLKFPEGCYKMDGKRPYCEMSFGVYNIFKLLQVEYIHRFNYNELPTATQHCVKFIVKPQF
ncbi:MAG: DUF5686 family protein [Prevotellaceae bacterium]|nr:DUF5686 family protein [Prevotellaceae bacterium]